MLKILGVVYYVLGGLAVVVALSNSQRGGMSGDLALLIGFTAGLFFAFFGAMCFAADDIRALLKRLVDLQAPPAPVEAPPIA
jgi:hypothetical protein